MGPLRIAPRRLPARRAVTSARLRNALLATLLACSVLPVSAGSADASGALWRGKLDRYTSTLSFVVSGSRVVQFIVPEAPAYCLTGFSAITVDVPSAAIRGGRFARTLKLSYDGETETIKLAGRLSGRRATGTVNMQGPCDSAFTWSAHHA
jgi:hypothetical protein